MCCSFIFCGLSYCLFCWLFLLIKGKTEKQSESQIEDAYLGSLAKDQEMTKKVRSEAGGCLELPCWLTHTEGTDGCVALALPPGGAWPVRAGQACGIILTSHQGSKSWKEHRLWDQTILRLTLGSKASYPYKPQSSLWKREDKTFLADILVQIKRQYMWRGQFTVDFQRTVAIIFVNTRPRSPLFNTWPHIPVTDAEWDRPASPKPPISSRNHQNSLAVGW